jgi:CubicO group peptidase (beta-lactamase class C family)
MQLAEQGKLDVEDPVDAYLPIPMCHTGDPIRIWHLMTHSSGIPALGYAEVVIRKVTGAGESWLPIASYADLLSFMADSESWTIGRPGERWFYLNEGYVLLGAIIEKSSGMPYEQYINKHVLVPLGMNRSFFHKEEIQKDADVATPYVITRKGDRKSSTYPWGGISSDGGLISNVLDLSKYVAMYLKGGEINGVRVISQSSLEAMQSPRVAVPYQGSFGDESYGFGFWIHCDFLGRKLIGHGGSVLVATAYIAFIPQEQIGIALLANGSGYPLSQFGMYGLAILLGEDPERLTFVHRDKALAGLVGSYETYKGTVQAQVKRKGDFLSIEIRDKYTDLVVPLVPETLEKAHLRFYTIESGQKLPVEFWIEDKGISLLYQRYCFRKTGKTDGP